MPSLPETPSDAQFVHNFLDANLHLRQLCRLRRWTHWLRPSGREEGVPPQISRPVPPAKDRGRGSARGGGGSGFDGGSVSAEACNYGLLLCAGTTHRVGFRCRRPRRSWSRSALRCGDCGSSSSFEAICSKGGGGGRERLRWGQTGGEVRCPLGGGVRRGVGVGGWVGG